MLFAHGFGCDQNMWRFVAPAFEDDYRVVLFDHVGAGGSDLSAYDPSATRRSTATPQRRAGDLPRARPARRRLRRALGERDDRRAGRRRASPSGSAKLVLVGPSPRYIDDDGYVGGFSARGHRRAARVAGQQLPGLVERDGAGDHGQRRPARARRGADEQLLPHRPGRSRAQFARVTFLSDNRADLARVRGAGAGPAVLATTSIAPAAVGEYVHRRARRQHASCMLDATGHCPNLSAPDGDDRGDPGVPLTCRPSAERAARGGAPRTSSSTRPCGYLATRPDGTIVRVNADVPAAGRATTREELVGGGASATC